MTSEELQLIQQAHYTSVHNHTYYSSIRLLDSIIKPNKLIDYTIELGYNGLAITDHELLAALPNALWYVDELQEKNEDLKDFKFILGNECYLINDLTETKKDYKKYKNGFYHLVLLAKDFEGYEQLKILSSSAWENSYSARKMTRVPLLKRTLSQVVEKSRGHLICSSACLGSELDRILMEQHAYELNIEKYKHYIKDARLTQQTINDYKHEIELAVQGYNDTQKDLEEYFNYFIDLFGEDYYLELQPSNSMDQVYVNKRLVELGKELNIKWIVTTDSHYLKPEDREIHKAYLQSKEGDREVDEFYATTYVMPKDEIVNYLTDNGISFEDALAALENTKEIYDKCSHYKLERGYQIPKIEVKERLEEIKKNEKVKEYISHIDLEKYKNIKGFMEGESEQNCYYIYACLEGAVNKHVEPTEKVLTRIDEECEELLELSKQLGVDLSQYYVTMQKIIDLAWTEGDSLVGPGRG